MTDKAPPRMHFRTYRYKGAVYLHWADVVEYIEQLEMCVADGPTPEAMSNIDSVREAARNLRKMVEQSQAIQGAPE